jgi:dTMP kinase
VSLFITFEGPDGSGKTTQIRLLASALEALGYSVLITREPGGTLIGNAIRSILLSPEFSEMAPRTEALLYISARAQIVHEVIRPTIAKGTIVLCDRFGDSTLAYQGYGHGQDVDELRAIINFATGGLRPELTLYLDVDVTTGLQRKQPALWDRVEAYDITFHENVRKGYRALIADDPGRWAIVDGEQAIEDIHAQVMAHVQAKLATIPLPQAGTAPASA